MSDIKPQWFYNLSEKEKKELELDYKACALTRERLVEILEKEIQKSLKEMRDVAKHGNVPDLSAYYADELSRQRTLEEVISLIK